MLFMEEFEVLVKRSYNFNKDNFNSDPRWRILHQLYNNNFLVKTEESKIPKKIHQIWLGSEMPDRFKQYSETWKAFHPQWEYKLWNESNIHEIDIPNRALYNSITHIAQKSDFLRYHILRQFGGLYVDTDFECLKSFDSLSYLDFYVGVGYPTRVELYIGLIACVPQHPVIRRAVNVMRVVDGTGWRGVFNTTGTYFFTNNFFKVVRGTDKGIVALPTDYFYPFPNVKNHHELNGRDYIKDRSFALHHWCVSWRSKKS